MASLIAFLHNSHALLPTRTFRSIYMHYPEIVQRPVRRISIARRHLRHQPLFRSVRTFRLIKLATARVRVRFNRSINYLVWSSSFCMGHLAPCPCCRPSRVPPPQERAWFSGMTTMRLINQRKLGPLLAEDARIVCLIDLIGRKVQKCQ